MSAIDVWFNKIRDYSNLSVSRIPLQVSREWSLQDGFIIHHTGRFFQVAGLRYQWGGHDMSQPIFVQQEIGTLGFIINEYKLLAYAKVEPGNVGGAQLAPTCQATASNLEQIHGGGAPSYAELFSSSRTKYIYDTLQSEQGSRFYKKQNRNTLISLSEPISIDETHQWLEVDAVLELMKHDFLVNTDARSTIVCSPWNRLVKRNPFARTSEKFSSELAESYQVVMSSRLDKLTQERNLLQKRFTEPELIPIPEIDDWKFEAHGLIPKNGNVFEVFQIQVHVDGREKTDWDQPIISSSNEGYVELICGRIDGLLHFLFKLQAEPGLFNIVELHPSLVVSPGSNMPKHIYASYPGASIIAECKQSDEGGRFFQDVSTYRLVDIGEAFSPPQHGHWLTLSQIRSLLNESGWFTNESRSAISLVLTWL